MAQQAMTESSIRSGTEPFLDRLEARSEGRVRRREHYRKEGREPAHGARNVDVWRVRKRLAPMTFEVNGKRFRLRPRKQRLLECEQQHVVDLRPICRRHLV